MPISYKLNLVLFFSCMIAAANAQTAKSYAVMLERRGTQTPVELVWNSDANATSYTIYRRTPGTLLWGNAIVSSTTDTTFTDNNATSGVFEYYVKSTLSNGDAGHGYILVNTQVESLIRQGRLLLLIDANYRIPLSGDIAQLIRDLAADGWYTDTLVIERNEPVTGVKQKISAWYNQYKNDEVKPQSLYLFGHIPVPYSGDIFPDGHRPEHRGAWPADVYYGVMNENIWTDNSVDVDSASREINRNVPGDGKFDPDYIFPDTSSLEIGRLDLTDMPAFPESDTLLMRYYLQKAHAFKTMNLVTERRTLIDDRFGAFEGEAFASTGWRNFSTMTGIANVKAGPLLASTKNESYLLTYACGPGTYTSAANVVNTGNLVTDSLHTIFTFFFGSFFGDWNSQNNLLRAPLCSKPMALASAWSGRPHWPLHHMSLGYPIGRAARMAQNNLDGRLLSPPSLSGYFSSSFPTYVHISLMGDPTLRLFYNPVPANITGTPNIDSSAYLLTWDTIPGAIGYEIYVSQNIMHGGHLVKSVTGSSATIDDILPGINHIYLRARYVESSASGLFHQLSLGGYHNVTGGVNAVGLKEKTAPALFFTVYPNPSLHRFSISGAIQQAEVEVYDLTGKRVLTRHHVEAGTAIEHQLSPGLYMVRVTGNGKTGTTKLVVE